MASLLVTVRSLLKHRGLTITAILTLALGIGANTALFSVLNAVLLRPLPYREADRLILIANRIPQLIKEPIPMTAHDVVEYGRRTRSFDGVAGFQTSTLDLIAGDQIQRVQAASVNWNLFPLLGVQPLVGRTFTPEEDKPGQYVAVLTHALWQRAFGGDHNVVGQTVTLDRKPYRVIGVMPRGFQFPQRAMGFAEAGDLWVPMAFTDKELKTIGDNFNYSAIARLKAGVSMAQAEAEIAAVGKGLYEEAVPAPMRSKFTVEALVLPLRERVVGKIRPLLLVLVGAVGLVLLIACANIANLLMTRAAGRRREMAVRTALGASRWALARQALQESLLLSGVGGALGMAMAHLATAALVRAIPYNVPRGEEVGTDGTVLLFTLGLSVVTGLLFGLAPALSAASADVNEALKQGGRSGTAGRRHGRLSGALVTAQVAVAIVLLTGAGLLVRSFVLLRSVDTGVRQEGALALSLQLPEQQYKEQAKVEGFYRNLIERLEALPGVTGVGAGTGMPMRDYSVRVFTREGQREVKGRPPVSAHAYVTPGYLRALGLRLERGRWIEAGDVAGAERVAVINRTMALRHFAGEDPIGKRIKWGLAESDVPWMTVVGVVADVKNRGLARENEEQTYGPYYQSEFPRRALHVIVRTVGDPTTAAAAAREQVRALDPQQGIGEILPVRTIFENSVAPERFQTSLLTVFAVVALVLSAIGLFGVMANAVAQRTRDIGIRMALGARQWDVLREVLGRGLRLVGVGTAIGLAAALALTRLVEKLLYGVTATDPLTFAAAPLLLCAVALVAAWLPARRAARVDPMVALHYE
ncbi:MAG: ABC transporter permease [Bryobacteraceae bacterium]|nr:ABC transporter permease [Bryobacteraceae bacterium]